MKYWCANFDNEDCLLHGIEGGFWMMHYQYKKGDKSQRKGVITKNYNMLKSIGEGDMLVAFLVTNTFYAFGKVIAPRQRRITPRIQDSVARYVTQHTAYDSGFVFFDDALAAYENHTDPWQSPAGTSFPVRIDVEIWQQYQPAGVVVQVLTDVPPDQMRHALFELTEEQYNRIIAEL